MKELLNLFYVFARIGAFTFGGGYAMLPIIQKELVEKRGYATEDEIIDYYAIGQLTPGVIAVNVSTFIGYKKKGLIGAIFSTTGLVFFPVIIITLIAAVLTSFADNYYVQCALTGIRAAVLGMVVKTIIQMAKKGAIDIFTWIIMIVSFILMLLGAQAVFVVIGAALFGLVIKNIKDKCKKEEQQ